MFFNIFLLILVFINVSTPGDLKKITQSETSQIFTLADLDDSETDAKEDDFEENSIEAEYHFIPVNLGHKPELLVIVHEGELPIYICQYIQKIQVPPAA